MLVYQDCPMCGSRKNWGEKQTKIADDHGFEIVNTPFYKTGVDGLIKRATEFGIGRLPFFTDGQKFSYSLEDFVEKPMKKSKTRCRTSKKRNTKSKREAITKDGANTKS